MPGSGALHFYDVHADRHVDALEVTPSAFISRRNGRPLPFMRVAQLAFSPTGTAAVTLEAASGLRGGSALPLVALKFWDATPGAAGGYALNTRVDRPHRRTVTAVAFHPTRQLVVTTCVDGAFKVWQQVEREDAPSLAQGSKLEGAATRWRCIHHGKPTGKAVRDAAFSPDGSLLALASGSSVVLLHTASWAVSRLLSFAPESEAMMQLTFIGSSPFLAVAGGNRLYVWDLLSCRLTWSYAARVLAMAATPAEEAEAQLAVAVRVPDRRSYVAAGRRRRPGELCSRSRVFLFKPTSHLPLLSFSVQATCLAMAFAPSPREDEDTPASSCLLLFNSRGDLLRVAGPAAPGAAAADAAAAASAAMAAGLSSLQGEAGGALSALYGAMGAGEDDSSVSRSRKRKRVDTDADGAALQRDVASMLSAPSHVVPSVGVLFKSYIGRALKRARLTPAASSEGSSAAAPAVPSLHSARQAAAAPAAVLESKPSAELSAAAAAAAVASSFEARQLEPLAASFTDAFRSEEFTSSYRAGGAAALQAGDGSSSEDDDDLEEEGVEAALPVLSMRAASIALLREEAADEAKRGVQSTPKKAKKAKKSKKTTTTTTSKAKKTTAKSKKTPGKSRKSSRARRTASA
eukprot:PLAT3680.5.p1 GENE.PLAT3680.5~~PLAT3680.5.p1  ORF type:complete len:682 (+),score=342.02 PLAT3680.5:152-2047(+)